MEKTIQTYESLYEELLSLDSEHRMQQVEKDIFCIKLEEGYVITVHDDSPRGEVYLAYTVEGKPLTHYHPDYQEAYADLAQVFKNPKGEVERLKQVEAKANKSSNKYERICILLAVALLCLVGLIRIIAYFSSFSTTREYYTDQQIVDYVKDVFGEDFTFIRKEGDHEYIYEDPRGISFSVRALADAVLSMDGADGPLFRKAVIDDYWESVVEYYEEDIEKLAGQNGMEAKYYQYDIVLRVDALEDIDIAAQVMEEIDSLLSMDVDYEKGKLRKYEITVIDYSLKITPALAFDSANDSWVYQQENRVCDLEISMKEEDRLKKEEILERIERNLRN